MKHCFGIKLLGDNYSLCKPNVTAFNSNPFSGAQYPTAPYVYSDTAEVDCFFEVFPQYMQDSRVKWLGTASFHKSVAVRQ